mgnify:CR=1 FL=1
MYMNDISKFYKIHKQQIYQCTGQKNFEPQERASQRQDIPLVSLWDSSSWTSPPKRFPTHGTFTSRVQLSSLAMSARLSHSAIGSPYDRTPAHCPNAAKLRPSPWWSSSGVTATTCLHSNWLLTKSLERNKHTHRNARIPSG